jgi:hypothetical protein
MIKRCLILFCFLFVFGARLRAINVSQAEREPDGEMTISFCDVFKIENIVLKETPAGEIVLMPRETGGYKNLSVISKKLDEEIKKCSRVKCDTAVCKSYPRSNIISARKLKSYNSVLAYVSLDGELAITVFVSKIKGRKNKDIYRVKFPGDLKFLDRKYRANLRSFLISETQNLL